MSACTAEELRAAAVEASELSAEVLQAVAVAAAQFSAEVLLAAAVGGRSIGALRVGDRGQRGALRLHQ